jgi:hypothetical protein
MTDYTPEFIQLTNPILYDHSIERCEIEEISCSKTEQNTLNAAKWPIKI